MVRGLNMQCPECNSGYCMRVVEELLDESNEHLTIKMICPECGILLVKEWLLKDIRTFKKDEYKIKRSYDPSKVPTGENEDNARFALDLLMKKGEQ